MRHNHHKTANAKKRIKEDFRILYNWQVNMKNTYFKNKGKKEL